MPDVIPPFMTMSHFLEGEMLGLSVMPGSVRPGKKKIKEVFRVF
jgi:hypothetical protein